MKNSYKLTNIIVVAGIVLMGCSYIKARIFKTSEIYPFFWWQLFTNPQKGTKPYTIYRLYEINKNDTIRHGNDGKNLDQVVYNSLINSLVNKIENNCDKTAIKKQLYAIGIEKTKHVNSEFLLKKEIYNLPIEINTNNHEFITEIIYSTKN